MTFPMDAPRYGPTHPARDAGPELTPVLAPELTSDRRVLVLTGEPARAPYPFASQNGNQLLLLDHEADGWIVAELHFDVTDCRYAEVRRATYAWSREAIGALLSRALAVSDTALIDTVERLDLYTRLHYGFALYDA